MISGGVATFVADGEAGAVALIASGAVFLVVAMSGALPTRLKVGGNEAEWDAVQEYVTTTADQCPADLRPELMTRLNELAKTVPQIAGPAIQGLLYERMVFDMVYEVARELDLRMTQETSALRAAGCLVFATPAGSWISFDAVHSGRRPEVYERSHRRFADLKRTDPTARLIIIVPWPTTFSTVEFMNRNPDTRVVQVIDTTSFGVLRQAIRDVTDARPS